MRKALLVLFLSLSAVAPAADRPQIHVLFIGNSFTYFHNMPQVLETIASSIPGPAIKTELIAVGGATLKDHWETGKALKAIQRGGWDYVVLNEQSALGTVLYVNQRPEIGDPATFWKYAGLFDDAIHKAGAKTVILMSWKDKASPQRTGDALNSAFLKFAKDRNAILAPVSLAWEQFVRTTPSVNLYFKDDHHPSEAGSYLEACVLYGTLAGKTPVGAAWRVTGTPIEMEEGTVLAGKTEMLVDIAPDTARAIQRAAWDTVHQVQKTGGYPALPAPKPIALPALPPGQRPTLAALTGDWHGDLHFYPGEEALEMELSVVATNSTPSARLVINYNGMRDKLDIALPDFAITPNGITFSDPQGPNKTTIKFAGAFLGEKITGTATAIGKDPESPLAVYGTWEVKKN